jgi:cell division septum initiation protein DivIVA
VVSTPRYEEVAHYRQELDEAKRENEFLKRRIRELERTIRGGGDADAQRGRRGASTSASSAQGSATGGTPTTTASAADGVTSQL